jgi:hypothetical protein
MADVTKGCQALVLKLGARLNFYINEYVVARTYYRYYEDDWGIKAHTASIEPVKISSKFTYHYIVIIHKPSNYLRL